MEQRFTYRPAPLAAPQTITVDATGVAVVGKWALRWDQVTGLRHYSFPARGVEMLGFDLLYEGGAHSISLNTVEQPGEGARATYEETLCAVLARVPGMPVVLRRAGWQGMVFFFIGVAAAVLATGIIGAAIATGVSTSRLIEAAVPMLMLLAFGGVVAWGNRPGRALPQVSAEMLRMMLRPADKQNSD